MNTRKEAKEASEKLEDIALEEEEEKKRSSVRSREREGN